MLRLKRQELSRRQWLAKFHILPIRQKSNLLLARELATTPTVYWGRLGASRIPKHAITSSFVPQSVNEKRTSSSRVLLAAEAHVSGRRTGSQTHTYCTEVLHTGKATPERLPECQPAHAEFRATSPKFCRSARFPRRTSSASIVSFN